MKNVHLVSHTSILQTRKARNMSAAYNQVKFIQHRRT